MEKTTFIYCFSMFLSLVAGQNFTLKLITPDLSLPSLNVSWTENVGRNCTVSYQRQGDPTVNQISTTNSSTLISSLAFASNYTVSVTHDTGNGTRSNATTQRISTPDAPTPVVISENMVRVLLVRNNRAVFYRIFVRRILADDTQLAILPATNTFNNDNNTSADSDIFYVTYQQEQFDEKTLPITVGDGTTTQGFENARLLPGQRYTFFQRSYFDTTDLSNNESGNFMPIVQTQSTKSTNSTDTDNSTNGTDTNTGDSTNSTNTDNSTNSTNTDNSTNSTNTDNSTNSTDTNTGSDNLDGTEDDDLDGTEIAIITVAVTIGIIALLFVVLCCCHWKFTMRYAPKAKPPRNQDPKNRISTHPSIPVTDIDFYDHVAQLKFHNFKGFNDEFALLRKPDIKTAEEFLVPANNAKNRYVNIPLSKTSRVVLKGEGPVDTYIHANYIPGTDSNEDYIVTQSPLPETVKDFWSMIFHEGVTNIVMIGNFVEKSDQICAKYFPDDDDSEFQTPFCTVRTKRSRSTADYTVRTFQITLSNNETKKINHYQFLSWPLNISVPRTATPFLQFVMKIAKTKKNEKDNGKILVHGYNNSDRAGIYVAIDAQMRRVRDLKDLNVYSQVEEIKERRVEAIKSVEEYIFVHDVLLEFILTRKIKNIPVEKLPSYVENARTNNPGSPFSTEYKFLSSLSNNLKMETASLPYNENKNRYQSIKPYDDNRVKLVKLQNKDGSDYINASWVDTYLRKKAFIASQAPLIETTADFWRMIYENKSWVIVMLGQEIENGELKADKFWPNQGTALSFGTVTIKLLSEQQNVMRDVVLRQIEMVDADTGNSKLIQFYQYTSWPNSDFITSETIEPLINLLNITQTWEARTEAKCVTLVTSSGVGRSGVFIALRSLEEVAQASGTMNIFRIVQRLRQQRTAMVQTLDEYKLIYSAVLEVSQNVRRKSIMSVTSFSDLTDPGADILPDGVYLTEDGTIAFRHRNENDLETTSRF